MNKNCINCHFLKKKPLKNIAKCVMNQLPEDEYFLDFILFEENEYFIDMSLVPIDLYHPCELYYLDKP